MKKLFILLTIVILLVTITATFVGCGDKDISDLKNQFSDLDKKFDDLNHQYNELDKRVKKLETTISLLDTVGESAQFTELKNKVTQLQKDLLSNSASDTQIKSQVTQMQLALDKIIDSGNMDDTILSEIQSKLDTLYGEVDRVLPFENGKEYEVKLNGVVYYTVKVIIEYHDGIVSSDQNIKDCISTEKHFCGSIYVQNNMMNVITDNQITNSMYHVFDNVNLKRSTMYEKMGHTGALITQIAYGENVQWYFYIEPDLDTITNYEIIFRIPNINLDILTLDNVWGDENGLKPPIVGTK